MATNLIRDPVHDFIPFDPDNKFDNLLLNVIKLPEFQRLRRIGQLGLNSMVYPGSTHSRFSHSLGVMHVARRMVSQLNQIYSSDISKDDEHAVIMAGLLHDVGHGPFSHIFEKITNKKHERWSIEIIESISNKLFGLTDRIKEFIKPTKETSFLAHIISSQLDADRFDYLLRDNSMSGAQYGFFDLSWIINCLRCDSEKNRLEVSHKGQLAVEVYVQARYHMYRNVYFHKTVRAAENLMKKIFERVKDIANDINIGDPILLKIAGGNELSVDEYITLDDSKIMSTISQWAESVKDDTLAELSKDILNRNLFKAVLDIPYNDQPRLLELGPQYSKIKEFFESTKNGDYYWHVEEIKDTPYRPYSPDDEDPSTSIYVQRKNNDPIEISRLSKGIEAMTKDYGMYRIFVHSKYFNKLIRILED